MAECHMFKDNVMNKVKANFGYASVYKILELILPLITSPLLARNLGANALGIYSYTYSFATFFILFGELGAYQYGMRELARVRENFDQRSRVYSDIYFTHIMNSIFALILYLICSWLFYSKYYFIMLLQSFGLIANLLDNSFLFIGMEDMKAITIRDGLVKIISFILILVLIRSPKDLVLYILIMNICLIVSKFIGVIYGRKYVKFEKPNIQNSLSHYRHMFILMIPVVASSIYNNMDKIMIGSLYQKSYVAYYDCATKALIPKTIITVLGTVLCPHIANLYANGKINEVKTKFNESFKISMILSYAFMFGISAIAKDFAPFFWGDKFIICGSMMIGLSISIPLWTIGEVIRNQFLLPNRRDNEYMYSFVLGVVVNAILNFILIPKYGVGGAIFATLVAELVMSLVQIYFIRNNLTIWSSILNTIPYFLMSFIMFINVKLIGTIFATVSLTKILVELLVGLSSYTILVILYEKITKRKLILKLIK